MNPLLQVKLRFTNEPNTQQVGAKNLRANASTSEDQVLALIESLRAVKRFYTDTPKVIKNMLIDVNYNDIIAKSNRIQALLKPIGRTSNDIIVGARFSTAEEGSENHIITYYVDHATVDKTITELEIIGRFIQDRLNGKATPSNFNETRTKRPNINYDGYGLSKQKIRNLIVAIKCISIVTTINIELFQQAIDRQFCLKKCYKTSFLFRRSIYSGDTKRFNNRAINDKISNFLL